MILSSQADYIANAVKRAPQGALHVVIADTKKQAYFLASDLDNFFCEENLFYFPSSMEKSEYKKSTALLQRTAALSAIARWENSLVVSKKGSFVITPQLRKKEPVPSMIVVTYTEAIQERVLRTKSIRSSILTLRKGESLSHSAISEVLFSEGFRKVDFVTEPGEFALRGSLVDIFSFADEQPIRIDFFGDEIESVRHFNPDNQLSVGQPLSEVAIYPNLDAVGTERVIDGAKHIADHIDSLYGIGPDVEREVDA